ncbi:MAG: orotidine-5'-phosphate decarboxylase [Candidatus Spyradocola sp.]|nr:orotidine-5'-phosphate decarboxylase [Candidatus Spyradocola sp.]
MKLMIDQLIEGIKSTGNPTCVGLDTQLGHLPEGFAGKVESFEDAAAAIIKYNKALVDALCGIVPSVKVQIAYYEMYGVPGMQAFVDTCAYAKSKGLVVIADAKRNDIGATSGAYANAFLGETPLGDKALSAFPADFVTVNAYLGSDGILPFLKASEVRGGGIFALVKTSNPSGVELQDLMIGDRHVYEVMGDLVSKWGESCIGSHGYSSVGAVVGATYPEQGAALRVRLPHTFFLVPGYGAQGATGKDLRGCFDQNGMGAVVNASRSILTAWKKQPGVDFAQAAYNEAIRMRDDIMEGM